MQIDQASKQASNSNMRQMQQTSAAAADGDRHNRDKTINQSGLIGLGDIIETIIQQHTSEHSEIFPNTQNPKFSNVIKKILH